MDWIVDSAAREQYRASLDQDHQRLCRLRKRLTEADRHRWAQVSLAREWTLCAQGAAHLAGRLYNAAVQAPDHDVHIAQEVLAQAWWGPQTCWPRGWMRKVRGALFGLHTVVIRDLVLLGSDSEPIVTTQCPALSMPVCHGRRSWQLQLDPRFVALLATCVGHADGKS